MSLTLCLQYRSMASSYFCSLHHLRSLQNQVIPHEATKRKISHFQQVWVKAGQLCKVTLKKGTLERDLVAISGLIFVVEWTVTQNHIHDTGYFHPNEAFRSSFRSSLLQHVYHRKNWDFVLFLYLRLVD